MGFLDGLLEKLKDVFLWFWDFIHELTGGYVTDSLQAIYQYVIDAPAAISHGFGTYFAPVIPVVNAWVPVYEAGVILLIWLHMRVGVLIVRLVLASFPTIF